MLGAGLAGLALAGAALAGDADFAPQDLDIGTRFKLVEIDQPDHDLRVGSPRLNLLIDTQTGRSWILQFNQRPSGSDTGYIWMEVPFVDQPKP
jgi:hypothetical protein